MQGSVPAPLPRAGFTLTLYPYLQPPLPQGYPDVIVGNYGGANELHKNVNGAFTSITGTSLTSGTENTCAKPRSRARSCCLLSPRVLFSFHHTSPIRYPSGFSTPSKFLLSTCPRAAGCRSAAATLTATVTFQSFGLFQVSRPPDPSRLSPLISSPHSPLPSLRLPRRRFWC